MRGFARRSKEEPVPHEILEALPEAVFENLWLVLPASTPTDAALKRRATSPPVAVTACRR